MKLTRNICLVTESTDKSDGGIQAWSNLILKGLKKFNPSLNISVIETKNKKFSLVSLFRAKSVVVMNVRCLKNTLPFFILISHFNRSSIVVHGDDILFRSFKERVFLFLLFKFSRVTVLSNSDYTKRLLSETWGISSRVVNPFVDYVSGHRSAKNDDGYFRLVSVGRLVNRKNHLNVLRAVKKLNEYPGEGRKYKYSIIGTGPMERAIRDEVTSLGLEGCVTLHGRLSDEDKSRIVMECNLMVMPSFYSIEDASVEGYGMVFIEASSLGIPSLCGSSGGMSEAVVPGVTGEVCDGSVDDIVRSIALMEKSEYRVSDMLAHAAKHDFTRQDQFYELVTGGS